MDPYEICNLILYRNVKKVETPKCNIVASIPATGHPGFVHNLILSKKNHIYCTCPAWKFQKKDPSLRTCKHVDQYHQNPSEFVQKYPPLCQEPVYNVIPKKHTVGNLVGINAIWTLKCIGDSFGTITNDTITYDDVFMTYYMNPAHHDIPLFLDDATPSIREKLWDYDFTF
ncbi:MAG: hypothetical protein CMI56_00810 [Parcubacteria group bacterium]|nr:hypothetical protein [Parcubacteria group bacterium]